MKKIISLIIIMVLLSGFVTAKIPDVIFQGGGFDPGKISEVPKPTVKTPDVTGVQYYICKNSAGCGMDRENKPIKFGSIRQIDPKEIPLVEPDQLKDFNVVNSDFYSAIQEAKGKYDIDKEKLPLTIYFAPSEQDWSRGLNKYKTKFQTTYTIKDDGSITETVTETVQQKLSEEDQKEYDKDKDKQRVGEWTMPNIVSQTSFIREDDKITGKIVDHFYDGKPIGSFETRISVDPKTDKVTQTGTMIIDGVRYTFDQVDEDGNPTGKLSGDRSLGDIYDDLLAGKTTPEAQAYLRQLESGFSGTFDSDKIFEDLDLSKGLTREGLTGDEQADFLDLLLEAGGGLGDKDYNSLEELRWRDDIEDLTGKDLEHYDYYKFITQPWTDADQAKWLGLRTSTISLTPDQQTELDDLNKRRTIKLTDDQKNHFEDLKLKSGEKMPQKFEDEWKSLMARFSRLTDEEKARLEQLSKMSGGEKLTEDEERQLAELEIKFRGELSAEDQKRLDELTLKQKRFEAKQEIIHDLLDEVDAILADTGTITPETLNAVQDQINALVEAGMMTAEESEKLRSALQAASEGRELTDEEKANLAALKGKVDDDKKKQLKQSRKEQIDEYIGGDFSMWNKITEMGFWRFMGVWVHAYNKYKGLGRLTALIFGYGDEEIAARRQVVQQDFCSLIVTGAISKECFTSLICGGYINTHTDNYVLTTGPDRETPMATVLIVGEKSDPIRFKGETRNNLISLFGDYTYINREKIDFTDIDFDPAQLDVIMWLYHAQLNIKNPLVDKAIYVNMEFRGPNREAKWFADWQEINKTKTLSKNILRYSTTDYNEICVKFKEPLTNYRGDSFGAYCSPFVGAGPATTIDGRQAASDDQQDPDFPEGAQI